MFEEDVEITKPVWHRPRSIGSPISVHDGNPDHDVQAAGFYPRLLEASEREDWQSICWPLMMAHAAQPHTKWRIDRVAVCACLTGLLAIGWRPWERGFRGH